MKIVQVTTREQLQTLYDNSAFTIEGLSTDEENLNDLKEFIKQYGAWQDDSEIWITKGKFMNEVYRLTGDNAYPDDCSIVSAMNVDLMKLVFPRFQVGGRWFDDIVANNASREEEDD